ncbi:YheC/YheD family protein [Virgibacillus kimchii]
MSASTDKQLQQVNNIFQTLIEATEHFHKLIQKKELNQSIFIFSSIVEGFDAVSKMDNNKELAVQNNKIESYLLEIAKLLEKGKYAKINGIIQFSLLPLLNKISRSIANEIGDQEQDKKYTIGVFHSFRNPREFYMEARVNALVEESNRQNAEVLFFTSSDVDFENRQITADKYLGGKWERVTAPFPDVINNAGAGKRSHVERKLRRIIPFTSFFVGNKYTLPKRMAKYRKYAELLVPFRVCRNETDIYEFIERNNKVVFKHLRGNRGENIYFVTKKGNRYILLDQKKEQVLNYEAFNKWIQTMILREKGSYIVQRYIHTRTKYGEPYHIRAQVQKDGSGNWVITHMYVTIGDKRRDLSNLNAGGRREELHYFLHQEFGKKKGIEYEKTLPKLAINIAMHLDKLYGFVLDELGLDLAIDDTGRIWMHEANNGPVTRFFDDKRAVHTIAYARYIAENGIFHSDTTRKAEAGFFQARNTRIPLVDLGNSSTVGLLMGRIVNDRLAVTCAEVSKKQGVQLFTFTPKDVDYDEMLIKGYFYENDAWVPKVVEYPDVIIDRLKLRGEKDAQWIYEEMEDIPFTNEWASWVHSRSDIYNRLLDINELGSNLSPFQKLIKTRDIFRFIEEHGRVQLKQEIGTGTQYIEPLSDRIYAVEKGLSVNEYSELPLLNKWKELIKEKSYIIQKDARKTDNNGQVFSIHIHLMLNEKEEWRFVSVYSEIESFTVDGKVKENLKEDLNKFLSSNYGIELSVELELNIKKLAKRVANSLQFMYGDVVSEVAIEMAIDENNQLCLQEVNPNGPETIYDVTAYAESLIRYADYVAFLDEEK